MPITYGAGQAVEVERDGQWLAGRVLAIHENGSYRVRFDLDDDDEDVDLERLRALGAPTGMAPPLMPSNAGATLAAARASDAPSWAHAPHPALEKRLEDLLIELAAELRASRGVDPARDRAAMAKAIREFYDVRQTAREPRRGFAVHFFWADGVGLDARHRHLHERLADIDPALVDTWAVMFDRVLPEVP